MQLRPYQTECIEAIEQDWNDLQFVMISLATGLGKTVIFSATVGRFIKNPENRKVMVLAHRKELLTQARDKMIAVVPELDGDIGLYQGKTKETDKRVIVASVQSCNPKRIKDLPLAEIDLLIIDEFHHAPAKGYMRVIEKIKEANPNFKGLGVTATPFRGDKKGLGDLVSKITYAMPIRKGIDQGYLTPLKGIQVQLNVDFNAMRNTAGDFNVDDLDQMISDEAKRETFVKAWLTHCGAYVDGAGAQGRSTACFTPTVNSAIEVCETFQKHGIKAEWLSGETPAEERDDRLARYSAGDFPVIVNCGVLTEGWDAPITSCIALMRPTQSQVLYIQMVGRGTRLFEGKKDCVVLDCVGTTESNTLITLADLSSGKLDEPKPKETVKDPIQEHLDLLGDPVAHAVKVKGFETVHFDIFGRSPVQWFEANNARVSSDGVYQYLIYHHVGQYHSIRSYSGKGIKPIASGTKEEVIEATETMMIEHITKDSEKFKLMRSSRWLAGKRASEKQRGYIKILKDKIKALQPKHNAGFTDKQISTMSVQTAMVAICYLITKLEFAKLQSK